MATQYTAGITQGQVWTAAIANTIGAAWESYTPTLTQVGTVAKTVTYAKYARINKICIVNMRLDVTGTGTAGTAVFVGLPLAGIGSTLNLGTVAIYDASAATAYSGSCYFNSTTEIIFAGDWSGANFWGNTPNIAIANGDQIHVSLTYELA